MCDDVGLWSGFKKGDDSIYRVDIGLHNIVEIMGTNNQVGSAHVSSIGFSSIVFDGGRIPLAIYFSIRR